MGNHRKGLGLRMARIAASLALLPALGLLARGEPAGGKAKGAAPAAKAPASPDRKAARAARRERAERRAKAERDAPEVPRRPARAVTPPTIDAAAIDAMLEQGLASAKAAAVPLTSDEEFVRRVSLDVTGKLPEPGRVREFVRSKKAGKRAALIDELLASPDYAINWARYWRDVVAYHATNQNPRQVGYKALEDWLAGSFAGNRPWDAIVTDLITATGRNDEEGAVNFTLAYESKPVELAGEVSRIFLGVQIQCAQCHDHKTDAWKREQFHELASFFAGLRARRVTKAGGGQPPIFAVAAQGRPRYTMPDLDDPQKQIPVGPRFFLDEGAEPVPAGLTAEQNRTLVASYITGQDNPWFAKAFVNRLWGALIGEGFINPIDDIGPGREASHSELFDALASQWQAGGYDIRWLFRTILNTRAYQRQSRGADAAPDGAAFAANCPGRLPADQILDALTQALGVPFDGPAPPPRRAAKKAVKVTKVSKTGPASAEAKSKGKGKDQPKPAEAAPANPRRDRRVQFNGIFGFDPSLPGEEVLGTITQSLFLMNNPQVDRAIRAGEGSMLGELLAKHRENRPAIEALYLRVLARRPEPAEVGTCLRYIEQVGGRREGFEDILWSLINSTEFVSRR